MRGTDKGLLTWQLARIIRKTCDRISLISESSYDAPASINHIINNGQMHACSRRTSDIEGGRKLLNIPCGSTE